MRYRPLLEMNKPLLATLLLVLVACDDLNPGLAGVSERAPARSKQDIEIKGLSAGGQVGEMLEVLNVPERELADYWLSDAYGGYPNCRKTRSYYEIPKERLIGFTVMQRQIGAIKFSLFPDSKRVVSVDFSLPVCDESVPATQSSDDGKKILSDSCRKADNIFEAALVKKFGEYAERLPSTGFLWQDGSSVLQAMGPRHRMSDTAYISIHSKLSPNHPGLSRSQRIVVPDSAIAIVNDRPTCEAMLNSDSDEASADL